MPRNRMPSVLLPLLVLTSVCCMALPWRKGAEEELALPASVPGTIPSTVPGDIGMRAELAQLQARNGLAIASYEHSLVDFQKRKAFRWQPVPSYLAGGGTVSADGTEIALQLLKRGQQFGIVQTDNRSLREFSDLASPGQMCWSHEMVYIAMAAGTGVFGQPASRLKVLHIESKSVRDVAPVDRVTSQCWSPDGKEIAFESGGNIIIGNMENPNLRSLGAGTAPT